jgi:hypothetical protein
MRRVENTLGRSRVFGSRLPPGVRDADCEGRSRPFGDAGGNGLWRNCDLREQELLSIRFIERHAELLRDMILDVEDFPVADGSSERGREILVGGLLWPAWICFRDRALREARRGGEFSGRS